MLNNIRVIKLIYALSIIISIFILPTITSISYLPENQTNNSDKNNINNTNNKLMSEEENIDSFTVNPKSGRWNVTETGSITDTIKNNGLNLINTNNDSTSNNNYFMERENHKMDLKTDISLISDYSGNQSEYFRDVIGDSIDFDEGDTEGIDFGTTDESVSNGVYSNVVTEFGELVYRTDTNYDRKIDSSLYSNFEIKIKTNISSTLIYFYLYGYSHCYKNTFVGNTWEIIKYNFSEFTICGAPNKFNVTNNENIRWIYSYATDFSEGVFVKIDIDYIKINGDLDFATHSEGSVEDTWNWEDSEEYFYNDLGNVSDFEDNSLEGWAVGGDLVTETNIDVSNQRSLELEVVSSSFSVYTMSRTGLSINAATYEWLTFEINSTGVTITAIEILDSSAIVVCVDGTDISGTFYLFSCNLGLHANWAGTETGLSVRMIFIGTAGVGDTQIFNQMYLYDTELGNLDGWIKNSFNYMFVNPLGYLETSNAILGGSSENLQTDSGFVIDTSIFKYFEIRIKSTSTNLLRLSDRAGTKSYSVDQTITNTFQTFSLDFSLDSDWDGYETILALVMFDSAYSTFEGDEKFIIDYIFLTSDSQETDVTFGFYDSINDNPVINVSQHYFNRSTFRFEVEFVDSSNNIQAYFYSNNITLLDTNNLTIRELFFIKIKLDVSRSNFQIEIFFANNTRFIKQTYPEGFTVDNDFPEAFSLDVSPSIFVEFNTPYITFKELTIDYIKSDFKERDWVNTNTIDSGTFIIDQPLLAYIDNKTGANVNSTWRLVVPRLDYISGFLSSNLSGGSDIFSDFTPKDKFSIKTVDKQTGDLTEALSLSIINFLIDPLFMIYLCNLTILANSIKVESFQYLSNTALNCGIDFSIGILNDRSKIVLEARLYKDIIDTTAEIQDIYANITLSEVSSDYSQEFVIENQYLVGSSSSHELKIHFSLTKFDFVSRDIFQGIINGISNFVSDVLNFLFTALAGIFIILIKFLADIFKNALDILGGLFNIAINALQTAILGGLDILAGAIDTIISGLESALDTLFETLNGLVSAVTTAITGLVAFFITQISSMIDVIIAFLLTILGDIAELVISFFVFILNALGLTPLLVIADEVLTTLLNGFIFFAQAALDVVVWLIANVAVSLLFLVALGWVYLFILPALANKGNIGDFITEFKDKFTANIIGNSQILGVSPHIPFGLVLFALTLGFVIAI